MVSLNHVEPTLAQRDGITLAYIGLVGRRALNRSRPLAIDEIDENWPDEQNDIGPTSFVNVGPAELQTKCQRLPNE